MTIRLAITYSPPPLGELTYLTRDIWHRYSVFTPVLSIYADTWYVTLDMLIMTPTLGIYTGTRYIDPVLDMSYLTPAPDTRYMICWTWHHDSWPDTTTPDTCIIWHIHDYHFYGNLAWLLYYYHIFGTLKLLYTWTPKIGRLLTLLLILYSCWPP